MASKNFKCSKQWNIRQPPAFVEMLAISYWIGKTLWHSEGGTSVCGHLSWAFWSFCNHSLVCRKWVRRKTAWFWQTVPLEVKLLSSLIVHLECSDLFFMPPEIRRKLLHGPNGLTEPYMQRLWDSIPQCNAPRARCLFWAIIPGPVYFQESKNCICTHYILIFDCISLLISSSLSMYYPPVKTLTGGNFEGFFLTSFICRVLLTAAKFLHPFVDPPPGRQLWLWIY